MTSENIKDDLKQCVEAWPIMAQVCFYIDSEKQPELYHLITDTYNKDGKGAVFALIEDEDWDKLINAALVEARIAGDYQTMDAFVVDVNPNWGRIKIGIMVTI